MQVLGNNLNIQLLLPLLVLSMVMWSMEQAYTSLQKRLRSRELGFDLQRILDLDLGMALHSASFVGDYRPSPAQRLKRSLPTADRVDAPSPAEGLASSVGVPAC